MREDGERDKGIKTEVLEDGEMPEDEGELWCSCARKENILTNPFNPDDNGTEEVNERKCPY